MTRQEQWRIVWKVTSIVTPIGGLLGLVLGYFLGEQDIASILAGGFIGALLSFGLVTFNTSWGVGLVPRRWTEASFLFVLVSRSLVWLVMIVVGIAVPLLIVAQIPPEDLTSPIVGWSIVVTFVSSLLINFAVEVDRLLGRGVLVSMLLGRYHRPREEIRIFLFVDIQESSRIAEQLGNMRYHAFLSRVIADVSTAAMRHNGEVHRYVGDEVILTWKESQGVRDGACVRAVLAMQDGLEAAEPEYLEEFGQVPRLWAGLHLGPVVTGEIGTIKHEIVYLGDTLNVASRIEQACRELQRPFLTSAAVIDAVGPWPDMTTEDLGLVELRGIGEPVHLYAVDRDQG